jgi:hypothetical protein
MGTNIYSAIADSVKIGEVEATLYLGALMSLQAYFPCLLSDLGAVLGKGSEQYYC